MELALSHVDARSFHWWELWPKSKLEIVIERHNLDPNTEEKLARIIDLTIEARNEGLDQEDADELDELTNWFYYEIC
jgi:hypothetical protein